VLTFSKGTETNRAATAPAVVSVITQLGYASVSLGTTGHVANIRRSWVRKLLLTTMGWSELFNGTRWYMLVTGQRIFFRWCEKNVVYSPREINLIHAWRSRMAYIDAMVHYHAWKGYLEVALWWWCFHLLLQMITTYHKKIWSMRVETILFVW